MRRTIAIQIDRAVRARLRALKIHSRETYNDVLDRVLEDLQELSPEMKRAVDLAHRDFKAGRFKTHEQVKRELGL
jgi:predicted transcriptional regulator